MFVTLAKERLDDIDCFIMVEGFRLECIPRSAVCVALKDEEYVVVVTNGVADVVLANGSLTVILL